MNRPASLPDATIARLLSKMRLSRRQHDDLTQVEDLIDSFEPGQPGFTYLGGNIHIYGPSPHHNDPTGEKRLYLDITNQGWDRPATAEGLAELEEILFTEWLLPEGYFDDEMEEIEWPSFPDSLRAIAETLKRCRPKDPANGTGSYESLGEKDDYLTRLSQWCNTVMEFANSNIDLDNEIGHKTFLKLAGYAEVAS